MSPVLERDSHRMTRPLNTHDSTNEAESHTSCSSYFLYDDASVAPIDPYVHILGSMYTSPTSSNASIYSPPFPNNHGSSEATAAALGLQFAEAIYSPPTVPFDTSFHGIDHIIGWQLEAGSLMQKDPSIEWWHGPWLDSGSSNHTTPFSGPLESGAPNTHNHNFDSPISSNTTTDERQHKSCADSLHPSPSRRRKTYVAAGSCQETNPKSKVSRRMIAPTYTTDASKNPLPLVSDVSFDPPSTTAHPNPRQPENPRRTSSRNGTQRTLRSSPATPRPEQRARNRTAAIKCRIKTKAAAAELEAKEKAESSRHEALLMTLRGLQADVFALKSEVLLHGNCDDGLIQNYLNNTARSLTTG